MDEKKKLELNEEQLDEVSGGETGKFVLQPVRFKRCAADPTHVFVEVLDVCPVCGSRGFVDRG